MSARTVGMPNAEKIAAAKKQIQQMCSDLALTPTQIEKALTPFITKADRAKKSKKKGGACKQPPKDKKPRLHTVPAELVSLQPGPVQVPVKQEEAAVDEELITVHVKALYFCEECEDPENLTVDEICAKDPDNEYFCSTCFCGFPTHGRMKYNHNDGKWHCTTCDAHFKKQEEEDRADQKAADEKRAAQSEEDNYEESASEDSDPKCVDCTLVIDGDDEHSCNECKAKAPVTDEGEGDEGEGDDDDNNCTRCNKPLPVNTSGLCPECSDETYGPTECAECAVEWEDPSETAGDGCCKCGICCLRTKFCNC